jgi:predicted GTPase
MRYGAAALAARAAGAAELIDATPFAVGSLRDTFAKYPHMTDVLPAMGYSAEQLDDLAATINATDADVVAIGTPIDLARLITIDKPTVRVSYRVVDREPPDINEVVDDFLRAHRML